LSLLAHRVTGNPDAPPLFLLNGGLMTMAAWEKIAAALEDAFRIVRCDFRGQLFSVGVPEPRLESHAEDLVARWTLWESNGSTPPAPPSEPWWPCGSHRSIPSGWRR